MASSCILYSTASYVWQGDTPRKETFAHGRYGDQKRPENEWIFSDEEYDVIAKIMTNRLNEVGISKIVDHPNTLSTLFGWLQANENERAVIESIEEYVTSDENLLTFLEAIVTSTKSSQGDYQVIRRGNLSPLLDFDATKLRLTNMSQDIEHMRRAREILGLMKEDL